MKKKYIRAIKQFLILTNLILIILCHVVNTIAADDCEIVNSVLYQREQPVIVTDWLEGIPYRRYKIETYPCVDITFRNNFWQSLYSTDIEVTATFTDQSTKSKKVECGKILLEPGKEFSCSLCFESSFPISGLACRFR